MRHHRHPRQAKALACTLAGALLLAGCSSDGGGDWIALFKAARDTWVNRDAPVSLNDAAAIPFATLGVRIDGGREQIAVLATDVAGEQLWSSGSRIAITTRHGRIIGTAGFGRDLSGYYSEERGAENWTRAHSFSWTGDFRDLSYFAVVVKCDVTPSGPEAIEILGKQIDTIKVEEACRSDQLDWSFTNTYWVSPLSGRVWRSIEHLHPKGPELEIELLRPPLNPN